MMPTICDGRSPFTGKKKPVTLVRMVVVRKNPFQPAIGPFCSITATTINPVMMPTMLMTTCTKVNVSSDIPRTMTCSPSKKLRPCRPLGRCFAQPRDRFDDAGLRGLACQILGLLQERQRRRRVALQQRAAAGPQEQVGRVGGPVGAQCAVACER